MIGGTLAQVSTLLMIVGLPHSPLFAGKGGGPRLAALALERKHQRRFLAADEGAGAQLDLEIEVEARPRIFLPRGRASCGLRDGVPQRCDGQRIFGADVDEALVGADGVGADDHAFEDACGSPSSRRGP